MEEPNPLMTTMRAFTNDFLSFMGIRQDIDDEAGEAVDSVELDNVEDRPRNEEANVGMRPSAGGDLKPPEYDPGRGPVVMTPRGPVVGSRASPFTRIALGYGGQERSYEREKEPMAMSITRSGFYIPQDRLAANPYRPKQDEPIEMYTAPSTKAPGKGKVPSYEPSDRELEPRGKGHGRAGHGRGPAAYKPRDNEDDSSDSSEEDNKDPNPRGKRKIEKEDTVCIVHRNGEREIVKASDPRVSKLMDCQKTGKGTGMYAKSKNGDQMILQDDQTRLLNARRKQALALAVRPKPYFTISVTILEIVLFIFELAKSARLTAISFNFSLSNIWGFGGVDTNVIIEMGGKYAQRIVEAHQWWRFITPIFLHVSIPHIVFNLLSQIKIGMDLERSFGSVRVCILYILCGIGGNLVSCCFLFDQVQAGASGSIFGQIGLMFVDVFVNWRMLRRPMCNLVLMIVVIVLCILSGMMPGVDNFAHVGGLVVGVIGGFAFMPRLVNKKGRWTRLIVVAITFPLLLALFITLFVVFYDYVAEGNNIDCEWCENINCAEVLLGEDWCKGKISL